MKLYKDGFEKANPDIEIKWVRDSTGIITAKLLAEKANPQADVVLGVAASSLALLEQEGMLAAYEPRASRSSTPTYSRHQARRRPGSAWTSGPRPSASTRSRRRRRGLPKPETLEGPGQADLQGRRS